MITIMVVDDSSTMRSLIKMNLLRIPGVVVVEACHGKDALIKLRVGTPALVITDVNMPEMDGYEFVTEVRKLKTLEQLPILMVTTKGDDSDLAKGFSLGVNDYLPKPINSAALAEKIKGLLAMKKGPADYVASAAH